MPSLAKIALFLALAQTGSVPAPGAPRTFAVAAESALAYRLQHKLHSVEGVSKAVEGRARILPDGTVQAMVRARVDSFDSGNGNRDAHAREVLEAARHPFVVLKVAGKAPAVAAFPATVDVPLRGELDFHGRTRPVEVAASVTWESPDRARVEADFPVSLEAHEIERPSLLFVKVEDRIDVSASLVLEVER